MKTRKSLLPIRLALTGFCLFRRHQCDLPPIPYSFPLTSIKGPLHKACYTSCGVCIMQFTEHAPHTVRCAVSVCGVCIARYSKKTDITRTVYPPAIITSQHNQDHIPVCTHAACKYNTHPFPGRVAHNKLRYTAKWPTATCHGHRAPTTIIKFWPSGPQLYKN